MTTKTKTARFSCDCREYRDTQTCEEARHFLAIMAEEHPDTEVILESYDVAMQRQLARERERADGMHWSSCRYHDFRGERMTAEIMADPEAAAALDRAWEQARRGETISQEELDRLLEEDEGDDDT